MTRAMVLLGAGASREYGAPLTGDLTNIIEQAVKADPFVRHMGGDAAFDAIKSELAGYLTEPGNFEQIYHCAHELRFTFSPTPGASDEFKPILQPFLLNRLGLTQDALKTLAAKMTDAVYAEISRACDANTLGLSPLAQFIERLRADHVTRIYTTNYDDFPLQAVPDLYTGFDPIPRPEPKRFEIDGFWTDDDRPSLLHLHGSVHMGFAPPHGDIGELLWFDDRSEALKRSSFSGSPLRPRMDGTSILRSPIVTGLEKLSRLQQRPLSHFYSAMARDAMRADVIYVIGSGLADLHLNTWLAEARARTPKPPLLVVDCWPHGFEDDTYFELDPKTIKLFHSLQVHVTASIRGTRVGNWIVSQDRTAAIWDRGFQAFLNAPAELATVLGHLSFAR